MEVINLNLIPTGALPVVHASQYDEGRTFRANLMDGSTVYTLDGTEVLECDVKKPDGNIVTVAVTNTSDSYVEIDTTLQMCACAGESLAELHITKGAQEIGTLNFILAVERSPLEGGIQSDSGIHNLQAQIGEAVADQYAAEDVVFDAAPVAGHGTGFAVTSEGVKNYVEGEIAALTIPEELDDLQDVKLTSPTAGQIMEYDGAKWKNVANPASTTNFGAPYDENTTYNVPSLVIQNNLLYKLNAGEDGTTGPWDPTKWTQTSLAELTAGDLPLGSDFTDPTSTAGAIMMSNPVDQTAGQSISLAVPVIFGYYYADQWYAYVPLPFVTKNTDYSISLSVVNADNQGDITNKTSVTSKAKSYFRILTTKTMPSFPNMYSNNLGICTFTITFA